MEQANEKAITSLTDVIASIVSTYFAQANAKDTVYSTSDGNVFENLVFANKHASTLDDKNVTPHHDANKIEVVDGEILSHLSEEQLELLDKGLVKANYHKLLQLATDLKLELADKKAETVIEALTTYKHSL